MRSGRKNNLERLIEGKILRKGKENERSQSKRRRIQWSEKNRSRFIELLWFAVRFSNTEIITQMH